MKESQSVLVVETIWTLLPTKLVCLWMTFLLMLNEEDSRENIVKLVSFGLEQWHQRYIVTQEPPKKKKKSEDISSTVRKRVNRKLCVKKFSNTRINE
jgi:hypothetical protein